MFCPKCGTENDDANRFCTNCGNNLQERDSWDDRVIRERGEQITELHQRVFKPGENLTDR